MFKNKLICCSGFTNRDRDKIFSIIKNEGGEITKNFTTAVTHLISSTSLSDKYKCAVKLSIPVVSVDWVYQNEIKECDSFLLPPFSGAKICVTGYNEEKRNEIKEICTKHGASYSNDLTRDCTHLVALNNSSVKFKFALKWGLFIINEKWVFDSLRMKILLDESRYPVESLEQTESRGAYLKGLGILISQSVIPSEMLYLCKIISDGGGCLMDNSNDTQCLAVTHYILDTEKGVSQE
jgi:hypothetical protein